MIGFWVLGENRTQDVQSVWQSSWTAQHITASNTILTHSLTLSLPTSDYLTHTLTTYTTLSHSHTHSLPTSYSLTVTHYGNNEQMNTKCYFTIDLSYVMTSVCEHCDTVLANAKQLLLSSTKVTQTDIDDFRIGGLVHYHITVILSSPVINGCTLAASLSTQSHQLLLRLRHCSCTFMNYTYNYTCNTLHTYIQGRFTTSESKSVSSAT